MARRACCASRSSWPCWSGSSPSRRTCTTTCSPTTSSSTSASSTSRRASASPTGPAPVRHGADRILTGLRSTITVALLGIVLTLVLGTLIGIAPLSGNWMVRRVAGTYVEVLRNLPPLLAIVFVNAAALASPCPSRRPTRSATCWSCRCPSSASSRWPGRERLGVRRGAGPGRGGCGGPRRLAPPGRGLHRGARLGLAVGRRGGLAAARSSATWPCRHRWCCRPRVEGLSVGWRPHGLPFVAVLVGLVLYTSSHVAEIVRGSILAVPKGQTEAVAAVGLLGLASACATWCCRRRSASPRP